MLRFSSILMLVFMSLQIFGQTHTNRGGQGPDIQEPKPCGSLILHPGQMLKHKYLKIYSSKKKLKAIKGIDEESKVFRELIQSQALELDLMLVSEFQMPACKTCLSETKQILLELITFYDRHSGCTDLKRKEDEIVWMKNIITYGK